MIQRVFLVTALLLFITACDSLVYSPDKENYVEINAEPATLQISWNEEPETLGLWDRVTIGYDVDIEVDLFSLEVFLTLNGDVVAEAREGQPLVWDTTTMPDGIYNASLVATARSGTGSLAERLGTEKSITFNTEKKIWVDNGEMDQIEAPEFTLLEDGSLKLEWEPYDRPRFKGYSVREYEICSDGCQRTFIGAADSTSWIDLNYDGRDRTYAIRAVDLRRRGSKPGVIATFSTPVRPTEVVDVTSQHTSETFISWEKTRFPLSFFSYSIVKNAQSDSGVDPGTVAEIFDVEQTSTTIPTPLGTRNRFYLSTKSASPFDSSTEFYEPSSLHPVDITVGQTFGSDIRKVRFMLYNNQSQHYLMYADGILHHLDDSTLEVINSKEVESSGDPLTMEFLAFSKARNEILFADNPMLRIYDMSTLQIKKEIDLREIYTDVDFPLISNMRLDDTGNLWHATGYRSGYRYWYRRGIGALNVDTEQKLSGTYFDVRGKSYGDVHPGGKYVIAYIEDIWRDPGIFKYDDGSLEHFYSPLTVSASGFLEDGISYVGLSTSGPDLETIEVRTIEGNSLVWSMTFPDDHRGYSHNLEENHFSYVSESEGGLIVRSLDDGSLIEKISYEKVALDELYHALRDIVWLNNGIYEWIDELK